MRKIYLLIILTLVALPVFAYQLNHYGNQFSFYTEREFHRIRAPDFFLQGTPGHPELPVKYLHYIIPPNMKVDSIRITINRTAQISGSYHIYPAQPDVPICSVPPWVPPDSIIYNSDSMYPNKLVEVANSGVFDGARLVTIAVYPLQYRPLSRRVFLVSNVSFEFRLSPISISRGAQRRGINVQRTYDAMLAAAVENDWEIPLYYQPPTLVQDEPPVPQPEPTTYTIITNDEIPGMMDAFQPFADWLTDKGIPAVVFPLSQIPHSPAGDDAYDLREFIKGAYRNFGTVWVLLGGDAGIVPFRKGWFYENIDSVAHTAPSDLYFSDMNGNWDKDGDGRWGEPVSDSVDIYPEVFVGRILARNHQEASNWVEKILYYEQNGSKNLSLFQQTTWIYDSIAGMAPYEHTRACFPSYFIHYNYNTVYANIALQALNVGTGFYQIYCHGCPRKFYTNLALLFTIWARNPYPTSPMHAGLDSLNNDSLYYVVYSTSCYNAAYDSFPSHRPGPGQSTVYPTDTTIADAFTDTYIGHGAVAFLGYTRLSFDAGSNRLHEKFCELLLSTEGTHSGFYSLGTTEGWSKAFIPPINWPAYHAHNLFGSPENEPWINQPGTMRIEHPASIPTGQTVLCTVRVSVSEPPETPVYLSGVRVCLHKQQGPWHEIYEIGWTDENGLATFEILSPTEGILKITCFRPRDIYTQYLPTQDTCLVGSEIGGGQDQESKLPKKLFLMVSSPISSSGKLRPFYELPKEDKVKLVLYDLSGRVIMVLKDERIKAGYYNEVFNLDKEAIGNGIYWLVLKSGNETKTKKLVLIK